MEALPEEPIGTYPIENLVALGQLDNAALNALLPPTSWHTLIEIARQKFQYLTLPDSISTNKLLAAEPFNASISDRALELFGHLNSYMASRTAEGLETARTQEILSNFFAGDEPVFSPESKTNLVKFKSELTFVDPADQTNSIFAHWHGKIRHRFFRMHFEWPVPAASTQLKVLYLGPKLTKS